ncbi:MAG: response regulator transcription factor [Balneolales bacterium]
MLNVIVVDDHPLMRKGIALTISSEMDIEVVAQASSAEEALDMLKTLKPDIAVVDISLPGMNGIDLIKHLQTFRPEIKILVVSRHDEELYAERAIRAGAKGYLMKLEAGDVIVKALRRIASGGIFISEEVNHRLLMNMATGKSANRQSPLEILSDRELEVFGLIGKGKSTREIADKLFVSIKTVETYRSRIKEKLNMSSASELMQQAVQWVTTGN